MWSLPSMPEAGSVKVTKLCWMGGDDDGTWTSDMASNVAQTVPQAPHMRHTRAAKLHNLPSSGTGAAGPEHPVWLMQRSNQASPALQQVHAVVATPPSPEVASSKALPKHADFTRLPLLGHHQASLRLLYVENCDACICDRPPCGSPVACTANSTRAQPHEAKSWSWPPNALS